MVRIPLRLRLISLVPLLALGAWAAGVTSSASREGQTSPAVMMGFSAAGAAKQAELEKQFLAIPSAEEARKQHRFFTAEPHPAGSGRNNELAEYIVEQWQQQGWEDVRIHRYDVLDTVPVEVSVEMVAPTRYKATLREDPYDVDPDTRNPDVKSGYIGFSASGDVTAPVVYANSGNPADYEVLRRHGIDVRGKIVLVRYSNPYSYRGFKALTAERAGAAGIIIYSDPAEDGFVRGKVFPEGPWGPESHIQRGAITYDFIVPGDPLTPGWPSLPGVKRIPVEEAASVPGIMAVPMSWREAKILLEKMDGPEAPKAWQGGLPIKYRLGGRAVRVRMKVEMDNSVRPNYVVEARIRGSELPDEWVVLGNHRDAWEFGGVDPSSGTASMMELTRALGELKNKGWRPRRTLVVCSWDGEEVALTGSTEWGEQFGTELKRKAIAYLNVDSSTSGPNLRVNAVASLAPMVVDATRRLQDPSGKSLYEAWKASRLRDVNDGSAAKKSEIPDAALVNTRIGSGSDHTVFLNHLGRPTIDLSFTGPYGVYHSMYDNHFWVSRIGDPGFRYHTLMAQLWGLIALRLSQADLLPFDFAFYAGQLREFVLEIEVQPAVKRNLDLGPLLNQLAEFAAAGRDLKAAVERALAEGAPLPGIAVNINRRMMEVELNWLNPDGIPGRPWFKHTLYAARYTYANLELPGLTEAVEASNWPVAREQARILEAALARNAALLREAAAELRGSMPSAGN